MNANTVNKNLSEDKRVFCGKKQKQQQSKNALN